MKINVTLGPNRFEIDDKDYSNQRIFVVGIEGYAYLIPYVEDEEEIFLKTIIPSRKFTKTYPGGDKWVR